MTMSLMKRMVMMLRKKEGGRARHRRRPPHPVNLKEEREGPGSRARAPHDDQPAVPSGAASTSAAASRPRAGRRGNSPSCWSCAIGALVRALASEPWRQRCRRSSLQRGDHHQSVEGFAPKRSLLGRTRLERRQSSRGGRRRRPERDCILAPKKPPSSCPPAIGGAEPSGRALAEAPPVARRSRPAGSSPSPTHTGLPTRRQLLLPEDSLDPLPLPTVSAPHP